MEWIERLNDAVGYIEEHLTEEIDYERLGKIAWRHGSVSLQVLTPSTPIGWVSIRPVSFCSVPFTAVSCHFRGMTAKFFSMSLLFFLSFPADVYLYGRRSFIRIYPQEENVAGRRRFTEYRYKDHWCGRQIRLQFPHRFPFPLNLCTKKRGRRELLTKKYP